MELYRVFIPSKAESCELPRDQLAVSKARASVGVSPKEINEQCSFCQQHAGRTVFSS